MDNQLPTKYHFKKQRTNFLKMPQSLEYKEVVIIESYSNWSWKKKKIFFK